MKITSALRAKLYAMLVLLLSASALSAQNTVSLGAYMSLNRSVYNLSADPYIAKATNPHLSTWGIGASFQLGDSRSFLDVEGEFYRNHLSFRGINQEDPNYLSFTNILSVGVAFRQQIPLIKDRLFISPRVGVRGGVLIDQALTGLYSIPGDPENIFIRDWEIERQDPLALHAHAALFLEYQLKSGATFSLRGSFEQGVAGVSRGKLNYLGRPSISGSVDWETRATRMSLGLGFAYPICRRTPEKRTLPRGED
jgi:hypothetical protein